MRSFSVQHQTRDSMKKSIIALSALVALPVLATESEYFFDITTDSINQPNEYFFEVEEMPSDTTALQQEPVDIAGVSESEQMLCAADESLHDLVLDESSTLNCLEAGEDDIRELSFQEILDEGWVLANSTVSASDARGDVEEVLVQFKKA